MTVKLPHTHTKFKTDLEKRERSPNILMDFAFSSTSRKLEKEQAKRREDAKKKQEQEKKSKQIQEERERQFERDRIERKIKEEELAEQQRIADEIETVLTGGIKFDEYLKPFLLSEEFEDDKITLPESVLHTLSALDAFSRGVFLFRLTFQNGKTTHAGVREFTAPQGAIGLSSKVFHSLTESILPFDAASVAQMSPVRIKYVRLPKVTYVKFCPIKSRYVIIIKFLPFSRTN